MESGCFPARSGGRPCVSSQGNHWGVPGMKKVDIRQGVPATFNITGLDPKGEGTLSDVLKRLAFRQGRGSPKPQRAN